VCCRVAVCGRNERNRRELRRQLAVALLAPLLLASPPPRRVRRGCAGSHAARLGPDGRRDDIDGQRYQAGYLLVASDGGIFSFGAAQFRGSIAATL